MSFAKHSSDDFSEWLQYLSVKNRQKNRLLSVKKPDLRNLISMKNGTKQIQKNILRLGCLTDLAGAGDFRPY